MDDDVTPCRSCKAEIVFRLTARGRRCPYNVVDGVVTEVSHFQTCPNARAWSKHDQERLTRKHS